MSNRRNLLPRVSLTDCVQGDSSKYALSITFGIVFGIILNTAGAGHVLSTLLTLPGPLFLRALQCAVIPMMFFNISVSIAQIYGSGSAGSLGKKVIKFYFLTTLLAVSNGIIMANMYASLFTSEKEDDDDDGVGVELKCPKGYGKITVNTDGNVMCLPSDDVGSYNLTDKYQGFDLQDQENALINTAIVERSLLDQVVSTFDSLVPSNFTQSFAAPNIISVIIIAIVIGMAMVHIGHDLDTSGSGTGPSAPPEMEIHQNHPSHLHSASGVANGDLKTRREVSEVDRGGGAMEMRNRKSGGSESDTDEAILLQGNSSIMREGKLQGMSQVLELFKELTVLSNLIIMWIVDLAPFCIAFLIAGSLAEAGNLIALMRSVAVYVLATLTGIFIHICVTLPLVFFLYTGDNPYEWLSSCQKAMLVALSTSSSAATLPITIKTVVDTGKVSEHIANVILPMGANVNMDGTGVGFPCVIMFLANADNLSGKLNFFTWINVALASTLGSVGAAPVPSAGLVTMITVWQTAFPAYDVPSAIAYVQAIDFLLDRFETMTNVTSDMFVVRMLQVLIDRENKEEELFRVKVLEESPANPIGLSSEDNVV